MRFIFSFCAVLLAREIFETINRGSDAYDILLGTVAFLLVCGYLYLEKAYGWLKFIGLASLISFCFNIEALNQINIFKIFVKSLPILFNIFIGLIAIVNIAVFILMTLDWWHKKFNKPKNRIKTMSEIFPNQKEDIPAENFQFMQQVFISFLTAHSVNDVCEIDENADLLITELHSDDEYDLLFHIDILGLVKDYSALVPQPKLEEFVILFIKSYYDEVIGYYTFRFSDSFSS
ncbi:hypothetical protein [Sphingobacterium prati]|uniref:hypothetical protein n=1 Tax=Sphingobacterium prati TaxID=2737006 RepID=UPI001556FF2D|nr:hypothetical protein [Sphingobacterium prati]NPE47799.1 hypothetical protein [Sphingobacterium prati]